MLIYVIAVVVVIFIIVAAVLLSKGMARLDEAVQKDRGTAVKTGSRYNPALTQGFEIPVEADLETQLREARRLAAKQAAQLPRGANMGIRRLGQSNGLKTAWQGVAKDPITAVKIAAYHGWEGVRTGVVIAEPAAPAAAPAVGKSVELVPGKDYPVIEITDDMPPAEVRKARIANAKAKSAAKKAAKAAGAVAAAPAAPAPAAVSASAATAEPAPANMPLPELIKITADMPPDEKRKARIANSKAKSAYKKALKAAGIDPKSVKI